MYSRYEKPIIKSTIFFYDIEYKQETSMSILRILEKYDMFPSGKIYAGGLTSNRFIDAKNHAKDIFTSGYSTKDVLAISVASGDSKKVNEYLQINLDLTFYKNEKLNVVPKFMPWNVFSINSTYGRLKDDVNYFNYLSCVKELIEVINPFYATIDDVDNKVTLLEQVHEKTFVPDRIQQIYWGNYFGETHCINYGKERILNIPISNIAKLGKGVMFYLSNDMLTCTSKECNNNRLKIRQYLNMQ